MGSSRYVLRLWVAYTLGTDFKPAKRDDVAKITYLDTYKNPIRPD
jgi:hypothetical protein